MEEQLISPSTAKIAKLKGANLISHKFYCEKYGICYYGEESMVIEKPFQVLLDVNNEFGEGEIFYLPTQSLLQKWLREVHRIDIRIYREYQFLIKNKNGESSEYYDDFVHHTYEEALEQALLNALLLIE